MQERTTDPKKSYRKFKSSLYSQGDGIHSTCKQERAALTEIPVQALAGTEGEGITTSLLRFLGRYGYLFLNNLPICSKQMCKTLCQNCPSQNCVQRPAIKPNPNLLSWCVCTTACTDTGWKNIRKKDHSATGKKTEKKKKDKEKSCQELSAYLQVKEKPD